VKVHFGSVIAGEFASSAHKRFDVIGKAVNAAALLPARGFALSPEAFRKLDSAHQNRLSDDVVSPKNRTRSAFAVPILPARSLEETRAFYERIGFQVAGWWPEFGGYAILARGDLEMHFFAHSELSPLENYAGCYWRVTDVDAIYAECSAAGLPNAGTPRLVPVENKPWGMREFAIVDPSGNLIRVGERKSRR
jgi:catechol 2,3-dioxygenase-like lactoylglutathione lyase family enzyme